MRGLFFQKPLEFTLNIEGESWVQGDPITGNLTVKNHSPEPLSLTEVRVSLAEGTLKKVRQKSPGAFDEVESSSFTGTVAAQSTAQLPWKFETQANSPITDSSSSLFLVYGKGEALHELGQLQLIVHPHPLIQEFLKIFQIDFRFVLKAQKAGKTGTELKLIPPSDRELAALEFVNVTFKFEEKDLHVNFLFQVKTLSPVPGEKGVKVEKRSFDSVFTPTDYALPSGRYRFEVISENIRKTFESAKLKILG